MYIIDSFTYSLNDNPVLECSDIEVAVERVVDRVMRMTARAILRDLIRNFNLYPICLFCLEKCMSDDRMF